MAGLSIAAAFGAARSGLKASILRSAASVMTFVESWIDDGVR